MKIALCTTTIHVPHALALLRKCSSDVRFFVAIDERTPEEAVNFCAYDMGGTVKVLYLCEQKVWKCSEPIGWNTLARRNIAFLEALKWGADIVISWDCDNLPLDLCYFAYFEYALSASPPKIPAFDHGAMQLFDGIQVSGADGWVDAGAYLRPQARHRGFPIQKKHDPVYHTVCNAKVGVAAGLILNDPDVDAVTRIEHTPDSQQVSLLAEAGFVVNPSNWTVFNTQNTAVIRELVPAWFLMPGVGRHDDIYASLIVQRVMRERDYHVHFGKPFALQQRHPHDLIKDLRAEIDGMENVVRLAELLDSIILPGRNVIEDTRTIYKVLAAREFLPVASVEAGLAYLEDCAGLL